MASAKDQRRCAGDGWCFHGVDHRGFGNEATRKSSPRFPDWFGGVRQHLQGLCSGGRRCFQLLPSEESPCKDHEVSETGDAEISHGRRGGLAPSDLQAYGQSSDQHGPAAFGEWCTLWWVWLSGDGEALQHCGDLSQASLAHALLRFGRHACGYHLWVLPQRDDPEDWPVQVPRMGKSFGERQGTWDFRLGPSEPRNSSVPGATVIWWCFVRWRVFQRMPWRTHSIRQAGSEEKAEVWMSSGDEAEEEMEVDEMRAVADASNRMAHAELYGSDSIPGGGDGPAEATAEATAAPAAHSDSNTREYLSSLPRSPVGQRTTESSYDWCGLEWLRGDLCAFAPKSPWESKTCTGGRFV